MAHGCAAPQSGRVQAPAHREHPEQEAAHEAQQPGVRDALHTVQLRLCGMQEQVVADKVYQCGTRTQIPPQPRAAPTANCARVAAHEPSQKKAPHKTKWVRLVVAQHPKGERTGRKSAS